MRRSQRITFALVATLTVSLLGGAMGAIPVAPVVADTPGSASDATFVNGTLSVSLDLGEPYDPVIMDKILSDPATHVQFSDYIKRRLSEEVTKDVPPGTAHPEAMSPVNADVNFDGSISELADHTGLIAHANLSSNASSSVVNTAGSLLLGLALSDLLRAACSAKLGTSGEPLSRPVSSACATVGTVTGTLLSGLIFLSFQEDLGNGGAWGNIAIAMLVGGMNAALWDGGMGDYLRAGVPAALRATAVALGVIGPKIGAYFGIPSSLAPVAAFLGNGALADGIASSLPVSLPAPDPDSPPCDIDSAAGDPCVSADSTTRALSLYYDGPLYQVQRASDHAVTDVGVLAPGGVANAAQQDSFCANTTCTISRIYDQTFNWNDLTVEGAGGAAGADHAADAAALPITIEGHRAYGLAVTGQVGYRDNSATGTATAGMPESMYMVASGTYVNDGCCFDYGNAEVSTTDTGNGHMDAVNLGTKCYFSPCAGTGPWVEADLENGLFSGGNGSNLANKGNNSNFVTAMLKNDGQTTYAIKGGNSQSGGLSTWWDGPLPSSPAGYQPMQQEGAIVLGTGGDNSNASIGSFFEGLMTAGYPSTSADNAVQANIVSAGYGGSSVPIPASNTGAATSPADAAVVHDGYSSVYTVDAFNNHLTETYLSAMGAPWKTQDPIGSNQTPISPGTTPVAVTHGGYTSVFTVDQTTGDLREDFLTALGDAWRTQNLSAEFHTPPTRVTPTALVHDGYTSVFTVDSTSGDLRETYLPAIGQPWQTQDLSANYQTPPVLAGTSPVAIYHSGYTSVYTVDAANHHLQETFLPSIGQRWTSQDLSAVGDAPQTTTTPTALVHSGYTSVYTVDQFNNDLQETYLPALGQTWKSQDLSASYQAPEIAPGTQPVALAHGGYSSVYTVDQGSDHLQETYLSSIGQAWVSQDLSEFGVPPTTRTPIPLVHYDSAGALTWTSVYTTVQATGDLQETNLASVGQPWTTKDLSHDVGVPPVYTTDTPTATSSVIHQGYSSTFTGSELTGELWETYLPSMGQTWKTQNLHTLAGTPPVHGRTGATVITHDGYTSVFSIDASGDLQETFLNSLGGTWRTQDLSLQAGTPGSVANATVVDHDGYVSVFTIAASTGHLWETYLRAIGQQWVAQDLTAKYQVPTAVPGERPVAVVHSGWVSVFTVDDSNGHLEESYLPAVGQPWGIHDLSAEYGGPRVAGAPTAIVHDGWTSVYFVGPDTGAGGDLYEIALPAIGDGWMIQDLSAKYGTPKVSVAEARFSPVALYHSGFVSVFTVNYSNAHLQETYLPAISRDWVSHDLSQISGVPSPNQAPSVLLHYDAAGGLTWTSVFSTNASDLHYQETYLPHVTELWTTKDMSALYGTPPV